MKLSAGLATLLSKGTAEVMLANTVKVQQKSWTVPALMNMSLMRFYSDKIWLSTSRMFKCASKWRQSLLMLTLRASKSGTFHLLTASSPDRNTRVNVANRLTDHQHTPNTGRKKHPEGAINTHTLGGE